jgi:hypothetical protein
MSSQISDQTRYLAYVIASNEQYIRENGGIMKIELPDQGLGPVTLTLGSGDRKQVWLYEEKIARFAELTPVAETS